MSLLNIGVGDKVKQDKSYRYKMPPLTIKIEGRGNGIKTVITNIVDVSKALHIDPAYTTKFFGIEYGAMSSFDKKTEKAVVNGAFQVGDMQKTLEKFIEIFILCPTCKLPELKMGVKSQIKIDCAACGHNDILASQHKLTTFILKNPPAKQSKNKGAVQNEDKKENELGEVEPSEISAVPEKSKKSKEERKDGKKSKKEKDEDDWFTDASDEAQKKRKEEEFANAKASMENLKKVSEILSTAANPEDKKTNAPTVFKMFLASKDRSIDEIMAELRRLQLARDFDEPSKIKVYLEATIDVSDPKKVAEHFTAHAKVLKRFCADSSKSIVFIYCLEDFVGVSHPNCLARVPLVIQSLYDNEVLDEDTIKQWYNSPPESNWLVPKEVGAAVRIKCKPFVDWLDQDEDEEEEDDE